MKVKVKKLKKGGFSFVADDDFQSADVEWIPDVAAPGSREEGCLAIGLLTVGGPYGCVYINRKQAEKLRDMLVEVLG